MKWILNKICTWLNRVTEQKVHIAGVGHNSNGMYISMSDGKQLDFVTSFNLSYFPEQYGRLSLETIVVKNFYMR